MRFLIFGFLISVCYAFDFDCLKGPKYWCANYQNAEKCDRITECFMVQGNQKHQVEISTNNDVKYCDVCMKFIENIESYVPKITERQFVNLAGNLICNNLQGQSQLDCKNEVNAFAPIIYQELINEATPEKICGLAKICKTKSTISFSKIFNSIKTEDGDLCTKCKQIFQFIESMFSKISPDEFKLLIETLICNQLPSEFRSTCKTLLDGYVTQLYNLIKSLLDGDRICPLIHLCSSGNSPQTSLGSWQCQTCLDVIVVLRKDLAGVSATEIVSLIQNNVCSKLNIFEKGFCNSYVSSLVPAFVNELDSSLTPQQICGNHHVCVSSSLKKPVYKPMITEKGVIKCDLCEIGITGVKSFISKPENMNKVKSFIKTKICSHLKSISSECSNLVDAYGDQLIVMITNHMDSKAICIAMHACNGFSINQVQSKQNLKGIECDACHLVVKKVKEYLSDPARKIAIKNFLKLRVCAIFGSEKIQCQQLVDEFFDIILNFIMSELDVDTVCKAMRMCSTQKLTGIECEVCERVMDEVIQLVFSNHSQQVVSDFVKNKICPRLSFAKSECTSFVNTYLPVIFSVARSTLNSKVLCAELKICSLISQSKIELLLKSPIGNNSLKCEICQFVVSELKTLLTNPQIQKAIEDFLEKYICSHFGAKQQECINDINQYYSLVINIITEFLKPGLCSDLRLCNSTMTPIIMSQPLVTMSRAIPPTNCQICKKFYNYLQLINSKNPDVNLAIGLVSLCNQVDTSLKSECLQHFRNFNAIIAAFNKSRDISEFCKMTEMCKRSKKYRIGKKPCSWGPGFWCISRRHANGCGPGAVKHCEMKVWNQKPQF